MKSIVRLMSLLVVFVLLCLPMQGAVFADDIKHIKVKIDNEYIIFDVAPIMRNDRVLVPLRKIFEKLGAEVSWEESSQTITAVKENITIKLKIDDNFAYIGEQKVELSQPPVLYNSRTMVPIRFVSEALNADVDWDGTTETVFIKTVKKEKMVSLLGNTVRKLEEDKNLTIGYLGGSITDGTGSSGGGSWRELTTKYFKENYPDAAITEINAGIGGTGSELGVFRVQNELNEKNVDLVFVEFAVNDDYLDSETIQENLEGIVLQLWNANPECDIVFVYTTLTEWFTKYYSSNKLPPSVIADEKVAKHYNIPSVNIGKAMYDYMIENNLEATSLITDGAHPNNNGYAVYADAVKDFLDNNLVPDTIGVQKSLPSQLTKKPIMGITDEPGNAVFSDESQWSKQNNFKWKGYPYQLTSSIPNAELTYTFTGTSIGLYWLFSADSGDIKWSLDNSPYKEASSWDDYAASFDRMNFTILADNLENKEHILKIKVSERNQSGSTGYSIRIGAFLIGTN